MPEFKFKCDGCGKRFEKRRGLAMHKRYHCAGNVGASSRQIGQEKPKKEKKVLECNIYGSHEWELLKPLTEAHYIAIRDGYTKICECGELA